MTGNDLARPKIVGNRGWMALATMIAAFVAAILGALRYSGLINRMGEWQFERLGLYFPMLSVLSWVALAGLVLAVIMRFINRGDKDAQVSEQVDRASPILLRNGLIIIGFVAGLVALGGAIHLIVLPGNGNEENLTTPATLDKVSEGNARVQGFRPAGPMARYSEGVLFWKNDAFLVPLSAGGTSGSGKVKLFAEVSHYDAGTRLPTSYRGILRRDALPNELYPLYASQGVTVEPGAAVVYRSSYSMALPTLLLIGEAAVLAIIAFLGAVFVHRRR